MPDQDLGVRVLHAFGNMTVGRVIFPAGMYRQQLLRAKLVEIVAPEYLDEQIRAAPANRMMRAAKRDR